MANYSKCEMATRLNLASPLKWKLADSRFLLIIGLVVVWMRIRLRVVQFAREFNLFHFMLYMEQISAHLTLKVKYWQPVNLVTHYW